MKIKLLDFGLPSGFEPKRAHDNDAGADVYATGTYIIAPNSVAKIPLGFGLELPDGCVGFVFPRSSMAAKGLTCELPPIDSRYRGEVHAVITNNGNEDYTVNIGDRIGQLVILPVIIPLFSSADLDERGTGAFGSTGA